MDEAKVKSIRVRCPHCSKNLKSIVAHMGRMVRCSVCGKEFRISVDSSHIAQPQSRQSGAPEPLSYSQSPAPRDANIPDVRLDGASRPRRATLTNNQRMIISAFAAFGILATLVLIGVFATASSPSESLPTRDVSSSVNNAFSIFTSLVLLLVALALYGVPSVVAFVREHKNAMTILILNIFFGWTFVGWVICLAWAFSKDVAESRQYIKKVIVHQKSSDDDD